MKKRAKPFLKWVGGKTQLIEQIKTQLPYKATSDNLTYIEPFIGSGAFFFWIIENFPNIEKVVINDINTDLINCYNTIQKEVGNLTDILLKWQKEYYLLGECEELKKVYFYEKRKLFNTRESDKTKQSALFIFLNRTCFNGLFRVNRKNEFNVPIGSYKKPLICNKENLRAVSEVLQRVEILNGDYSETLAYATENTFFYFDPPYKPLSETSSFNSYAKDEFNDAEQIRLKDFCTELDTLNHQWILSNSDVKGKDPNNNFFDDLYANFNIYRVNARRSINANPNNYFLGVPFGRALRSNLFARTSQKGFPLQSLT